MRCQLREQLLRRVRNSARRKYWSVYDRDEHVCQCCGADVPLEIHHRDGDALNNHLINLIAVCHRCHRAAHQSERTVQKLTDWKKQISEGL